MSRVSWFVALSALLAIALGTTPVTAQSSALSVVQATDGTLYLSLVGTSLAAQHRGQAAGGSAAAARATGEHVMDAIATYPGCRAAASSLCTGIAQAARPPSAHAPVEV